MKHQQTIRRAILRALSFLKQQQRTDGGFVSYSTSNRTVFQAQHTHTTVFAPALILGSIESIALPQAQRISKELASFLLQQKNEQWSFNYWPRNSHEAITIPYPDDLDDTFCTLSALWRYDRALVDERALASAVKLLISTESAVGGPYYTWIVPQNHTTWRDIDIAVNANVAYFLSKVSRQLPQLTALLEHAITTEKYFSPYYPDEYPILYYMARAYDGPLKSHLARHIATRQSDGWWGTPLRTALAVNALAECGKKDAHQAISRLLQLQSKDGSWPAEAYCLDPARDGQKFYSGSPALTTAFVIEALAHYLRTSDSQPKLAVKKTTLMKTPVCQEITAELHALPSSLRMPALDMLWRIAKGKNGTEIICLPQLFYESLQYAPALAPRVIVDLGKANLYGWMAYTIYDDFLDKEGDSRLLSVANAAHRRSLKIFEHILPKSKTFRAIVWNGFDTIDAANAWEVAECHFSVHSGNISLTHVPHYGRLHRLAERSWGHALIPLGILLATGVSPQDPSYRLVQKALRHYLIARQLSDDMHDWKEDLEQGRISYVVARMMTELEIPPGEYSIKELTTRFEYQFWHHTSRHICRQMAYHIRQARAASRQSNMLVPDNIIARLLDTLDDSIKETYLSLDRIENFLQAYRAK